MCAVSASSKKEEFVTTPFALVAWLAARASLSDAMNRQIQDYKSVLLELGTRFRMIWQTVGEYVMPVGTTFISSPWCASNDEQGVGGRGTLVTGHWTRQAPTELWTWMQKADYSAGVANKRPLSNARDPSNSQRKWRNADESGPGIVCIVFQVQ